MPKAVPAFCIWCHLLPPAPCPAMRCPAPPAQVVRHLKERYGKAPAQVLNVVLGSKGGVSGGTIASGMNAFVELKQNPELRGGRPCC